MSLGRSVPAHMFAHGAWVHCMVVTGSGRFFPLSAELRRAAVVEEDTARMTLPATARVDPDEPGDYDPETGEVLDGTWDEEAAAEEAMARAEREGRGPQS